MSRVHRLVSLASLLSLVLAVSACQTTGGGAGNGDAPNPNRIVFQSSSPVEAAEITGTVVFPDAKAERYPAVVLMHSSAGVQVYREHRYARLLREAGMATLIVDSFGPRDVGQTLYNQSRVSTFVMAHDAFDALAALARHPKIDPERIAVIGFSKGAVVALYASLETVRARLAPDGLRFAAHVSLYPGCNFHYRDWSPAGGPVQMQLGEADTYTGVEPCEDVADAMRSAGGEVQVIVHPDAEHAWDGTRHFNISSGQNLSKCVLQEQADGTFAETISRATVADGDGRLRPEGVRAAFEACGSLGIEGGPSSSATADGIKALRQFLVRTLRVAGASS